MGQAFLWDYTEKFNHFKIRLTCCTIKFNSQSLVLLSINPFRCCEWGWGVVLGDCNGIFVATRSMKVMETHTKEEAQVVALFLSLKWGIFFFILIKSNKQIDTTDPFNKWVELGLRNLDLFNKHVGLVLTYVVKYSWLDTTWTRHANTNCHPYPTPPFTTTKWVDAQ